MTTTNEQAATLKEMIEAWNRTMAAARRQFPSATQSELYQIVKGAMDRACGIA